MVIPCYNEEGNLEGLQDRLQTALKNLDSLDVILVDNGSTDSTRLKLTQIAHALPRTAVVCLDNNIGYGHGIKAGLSKSEGELVGWSHADLQTDPNDVISGISTHAGGFEVLIKGKRIGRPVQDRIFSVGMSVLESMLFKTRLTDINAQPTLFGRGLLEDVLRGPDDFSLDLFTMVIARRRGYRETRFPVRFGARFSGESKWNTSITNRWRFIKRTLVFSLELKREIRKNVNN